LGSTFQARARRGRERLGVNVNSLHAFAHSEELGGATRDYFESVARLTVLPNELRLLMRLAVATANQCRYCTAHQRHQLAGLCVSEEKMAAIWKSDADELTPRERAAIQFAQAITLDAGGIPADVLPFPDHLASALGGTSMARVGDFCIDGVPPRGLPKTITVRAGSFNPFFSAAAA
jgi:AhpD family alkylhydroperoxidase